MSLLDMQLPVAFGISLQCSWSLILQSCLIIPTLEQMFWLVSHKAPDSYWIRLHICRNPLLYYGSVDNPSFLLTYFPAGQTPWSRSKGSPLRPILGNHRGSYNYTCTSLAARICRSKCRAPRQVPEHFTLCTPFSSGCRLFWTSSWQGLRPFWLHRLFLWARRLALEPSAFLL